MEIVRTKDELLKSLEKARKFGLKVSFIPTMGNLHDGHLKLIEAGKRLAEIIVVSIFVNKKQFGEKEDFENYPRTEEEDLTKLEASQASIVFIPRSESEIFGSHFNLNLDVANLTNCLCGISRPHFFGGVLSVVMKFFLLIKPEFAIFGKKDYQQFLIVSALAESLEIGTEVVGIETVREGNGLAMSSRNNYFSLAERSNLEFINKILSDVKENLLTQSLEEALSKAKKELNEAGVEKLDYLEIRSGRGLSLITDYKPEMKPIIFFAGFVKGVRLIDNLELF